MIQGNILISCSFRYNDVNQDCRAANGFPSTSSVHDEPPTDIEDIDMVRLREITGKAVSGSLLLLIKWFKRSRKIVSLLCDMQNETN